eukprot:scaffold181838_cov22-Tisochrysis_lutea.AAC.2
MGRGTNQKSDADGGRTHGRLFVDACESLHMRVRSCGWAQIYARQPMLKVNFAKWHRVLSPTCPCPGGHGKGKYLPVHDQEIMTECNCLLVHEQEIRSRRNATTYRCTSWKSWKNAKLYLCMSKRSSKAPSKPCTKASACPLRANMSWPVVCVGGDASRAYALRHNNATLRTSPLEACNTKGEMR